MNIETARLRLRRLKPDDAARLAEYRSNPTIAQYQSWESMTIDEASEFINATPEHFLADLDTWCQFAIADKTTDDLLGDIGLCRKSPGDVVEIGFTLAPDAQGRGIAAEACRAAIDKVFSLNGVAMLIAIVDSRNTSALSLVRRLGMAFNHSESAEFKGGTCTEEHFVLRRATS